MTNAIEIFDRNLTKDNCVVCILSPFMSFGKAFGLAAIHSYCPHKKKNKTNNSKFHTNKNFYLSLIILLVILIVALVNAIYAFSYKRGKTPILKIISEIISITASLFILLTLPLILRVKEVALNKWIELGFEHIKLGFLNIISPVYRKKVCRIFYFYVFFSLTILSIFIAHLIYKTYLNGPSWDSYRIYASSLSVFIQVSTCMQFHGFFMFITGLYDNISQHLKSFMTLYNDGVYLKVDATRFFGNVSLELKLKKLNDLYKQNYSILLYVNKNYGHINVIWMAHALVILIDNIFLLVNLYIEQDFSPDTFAMEVKTQVFIYCVVFIMKSAEDLKLPVSF